MEPQNITPAEALFALYRTGFENGSTTVYEVPYGGQECVEGTRYVVSSRDPRVPVEGCYFARDADGLPYVSGVDEG